LMLLGVDTIEFGIQVENYEEIFRPILATLRELKSAAQETGNEDEITIGGVTLKVHAAGIRFYAYRLTCEDFTICFAENELSTNAPIWVRFMSGYLWPLTLEGAYESFLKWFRVFDVEVVGTKVSRFDICVDSDEVSFGKLDSDGFVTRAKRKTIHGVDDEHFEGKLFSGFTIGKGQPLLCRIYQKKLEIYKSGKTWMYDIWGQHGWEGDSEVWRVEYQMRREVLKELGVPTIEKLLEKVNGVWAYCTQEWLTLRRPNGEANVSRWNVRRKWNKIQKAEYSQLAVPLIRERVRQGNLKQLMNQAAGLAVSIAALGNHSNLDNTLEILGVWTTERLRSKNTSFEGEREIRKSRFLQHE